MNIQDLFAYTHLPEYKEFAKNEWIKMEPHVGSIDIGIIPNKIPRVYGELVYSFKDDHNAIGYLYVINKLYNDGIKVVKPTLEQCLAFENIEINIPFKDYKQPYETICVEFPELYQNLLRSRCKVPPPIAATCHKPNNQQVMIGGLSFGIKNYSITFFITNYDVVMEEIIKWDDKDDPDFRPAKYAERVALNVILFMTNFGHTKIGYENVKRHRYYERKEPLKAKQDFYYIGLNQEISLFRKQVITQSETEREPGTHASPISHWRRGHYRLQHHGEGNKLTKVIFIPAIFVCPDDYKGIMSDTKVIYS